MTRKILYLILMVQCFAIVNAEGILKTQGRIITDANNKEILFKGFGLGGWLVLEGYMWNCNIEHASTTRMENSIVDLIGETKKEEFFNLYRNNYITEKEISLLSDKGFTALRVPLHYRDFSPVFGQFISKGFEILDPLIELCRQYNIYLILDMHAAPGAQNNSDFSDSELNGEAELFTDINNQLWLASTWRYIAEYYSDEPVIGGYDLLNEPARWGISDILRSIYERTIDSIRTVDDDHIVIIEGNWYGNDHTGLFPPFDDNMIYSFHHYVGGSTDTTTMYRQYRTDISVEYDVPLWVGEFGENSNYWGHNIKNFFERNDIGWSWWNFKSVERISSLFSYDITDEYQILIDYWQGSGTKPDTITAYNGLMSMANSIQFDLCSFNSGLSRALSDSSYSYKSIPFSSFSPPGLLPAVHYDIGNNNISYFDNQVEDPNKFSSDTKSWNNGWSFRNDGVDIGSSYLNNQKSYHIGWVEDGEWTSYTIVPYSPGNYKLMIEIASYVSGSQLSVIIDSDTTGPITLPNTSGWDNGWRVVKIGDISISDTMSMKIIANIGGFNMRNIIFENLDVSSMSMDLDIHCYPNPNYSDEYDHPPFIVIDWMSDFILSTNIKVYNLAGNILFDHNMISTQGKNSVNWYLKSLDMKPVPSGVYIVRVETSNSSEIKKITYVK